MCVCGTQHKKHALHPTAQKLHAWYEHCREHATLPAEHTATLCVNIDCLSGHLDMFIPAIFVIAASSNLSSKQHSLACWANQSRYMNQITGPAGHAGCRSCRAILCDWRQERHHAYLSNTVKAPGNKESWQQHSGETCGASKAAASVIRSFGSGVTSTSPARLLQISTALCRC